MIEGGVAGSSALEQASQRRAAAERLLAETRRWEQLAADRRETGAQLDMLPPAYAVLHDLLVPGSATGVDHVVVGPGGSFLVMSRRYPEAIAYRDGQLWAGQVSLRHEVEHARLEGQRLSHILGSPVVPLVAFLQAVMPAAAPRAIEGVLVAGGDTVVRVITRASHTLLTSPQVADVVERALPLLHSPGSVVRSVSSKGVQGDLRLDPSAPPTMPAQSTATSATRVPSGDVVSSGPPTPPASNVSPQETHRRSLCARRDAAEREARRVVRREARAAGRDTRAAERAASRANDLDVSERAQVPAATSVQPAVQPTVPGPSSVAGGSAGRSRSVRVLTGVLVVLCLVAVGVGIAARLWWKTDANSAASTPASTSASPPGEATATTSTAVPSPTAPVSTAPVATVPVTTVPPNVGIVVPRPRILPSCPAPGAGWTVSLGFPGSQAGVTRYEVEQQQMDASWASLGALSADSPTIDLATGQPVGALWVLRLVAVTDSDRTIGEQAELGSPATPC